MAPAKASRTSSGSSGAPLAASLRSSPVPRRIPNRLNLTLLLVLQPLFLLASTLFIAAPLLAPFPSDQENHATRWSPAVYLARLGATEAAVLVRAASKALVAVVVVQGWMCTRLGRWCRAALLPSISHTAEADESAQIGKKDVEDLALSLLSLPFLVLLFDVLVHLLGAPLSHLVQATLLSSYLSLLVGLPLVHVMGVPGLSNAPSSVPPKPAAPPSPSPTTLWLPLVRLSLDTHPAILPLLLPATGTLAGTILLGGAALALDWQKPWQAFPLPCIAGAFVGLVAGNVASLYICWR